MAYLINHGYLVQSITVLFVAVPACVSFIAHTPIAPNDPPVFYSVCPWPLLASPRSVMPARGTHTTYASLGHQPLSN